MKNAAGGCRRLLVLLAAAVLLFGAAPARCETREVRIGIQYGFIYLPFAVAESEGFLAAEASKRGIDGVKLTISRFSGSTAVNEALLSNSIDFGAYGLPGLLIAWDKTQGRQAIHGLVGLALSAYTLNTNRPEVKSLADFGEQDRIAVTAFNAPQALLFRMAAEKQLPPDKAARLEKQMVSLPHPESVTALLSGNAIAAYFSTPPFSQVLAKDKRIHPIITSKQLLGEEITGAGLGGSQRFVEANPKLTQAVIAATEQATRFIRENPRRAAEIYLKSESSSLTADEVQMLLADGSTEYDVTPRGTMMFAEYMLRIGMLKNRPGSWKDVFFPFVHDKAGS